MNFNPANWGVTNAFQAMAGAGNDLQSSGGNNVNFSAPASSYSIAPASGATPTVAPVGALGSLGNLSGLSAGIASTGASSATDRAAEQARANARAGINTTQSGYAGGARQSLTDVGNTYDQNTKTYLNDIETGQGEINRGQAGNQLNLRSSMNNIVRGIQQGVRSGGVALAGKNAMDSGASDALARAYAKVGNTQTGEARGEAATVGEELMRSQGQLNTKRDEGRTRLDTYRDTETGRVRGDLGSKLDALRVQADGQGVGGEVNGGLVEQVINEAMARLNPITQNREARLGGIKQWTPEEIMTEALRLEQLGQAGNAFEVAGPNVNYGGGGQAVSGAPLGQMPIYMKGRDELSIVPRREDQLMAA